MIRILSIGQGIYCIWEVETHLHQPDEGVDPASI